MRAYLVESRTTKLLAKLRDAHLVKPLSELRRVLCHVRVRILFLVVSGRRVFG